MSSESNKQVVQRIFEEGVNQGKPEVFDELIAPNYINHDVPVSEQGVAGFKQAVGIFQSAFPDLRALVEDIVAERDRVATRGYFTGTHQGVFNGIPPTGKQIKVPYADFWRIENGRASENWVRMDTVALMQQLGVMPMPTPPSA